MTPWRVLALVAALLLAACGGGSSSAEKGSGAAATTTTDASTTTAGAPSSTTGTGASGTCVVARQSPPSGPIAANFATALGFAPDGRLFFAERSGTVRVVQAGSTRTFATVPTVTTEAGGGYSERGLLGLAISPTFATDRYVYAFYSAASRTSQVVVRWTDCAGEGRDAKIIIELPSGGDCCHKGGRLAFGAGGKLFVTLGDQHSPAAAADTADVRGKVLRYNADGTVPADNPFGAGNPVWASGFRNPFGLAISSTGRMAVTSNGPSGDAGSPRTGFDTVSTDVSRGEASQWPACYGYSQPIGGASCSGTEPEWSSETKPVVPTGAAFVSAAGPAAYAGKLVFCTINEGMKVLTDGNPHATVTQGDNGCRLDVTQGPDNALYVSDTDTIRRLG